jgi:hypothetical protein
MFLSTNYPTVYSIHSVLELESSVTPTQNVICYFCVLYNISLHAVRDFYVRSYVFKRSVYILYHAPHICTRMNKLEISLDVFKAGVTQMMNFRVTEFFSRGCFILHSSFIQYSV